METDETLLDLTGLKCPMPALLARRALARLAVGESLYVLTSDPLAVVDIPHMCHQDGHSVENMTRTGSLTRFHLRRGPSTDSQ